MSKIPSKILQPDPFPDDFHNLIVTSLSIDASLVVNRVPRREKRLVSSSSSRICIAPITEKKNIGATVKKNKK